MERNEKSRLIGEFDKNSAEKVRVYLQNWKNGNYCDIRVWVADKAGQTGAEHATRKGITIAVEVLPELKKAIDAAVQALEDGVEIDGGDADADNSSVNASNSGDRGHVR